VAQAMSLFAPRGWAMSGVWPAKGTRVALQAAADGGSDDEIDEQLTRVWNEEHNRWLIGESFHCGRPATRINR
jgi:hypothetical protein